MTRSTTSHPPSRRSSAKPRLHIAQPYSDDLSDIVSDAAKAMGYELLPWQVDQIRDWSAIDSDGMWVHDRCAASIPRQSGKSIDGIVWAAFLSCLMGYKVLWTDHNYSTTCEMLERFRDIFGSRPNDAVRGIPAFNKRVRDSNSKTAQEWFKFRGGGVLAFSTRTQSAGLGFSFDVVIYDEAQELRSEHVQAIEPTTTSGAKGNPQSVYLGTPTRAGSPAEVFQDVRADAIAGGPAASDLCWLEYGVEEIGDVADEDRWYEVNPSLGFHASVRAIRKGLRSGMGELAFAQEYLGYWLPKVADAVLTPKEWDACLTKSPPPADAELSRTAYGVKFSPDGSEVALVACCRWHEDDAPHVELVELAPTSRGTSWLAAWLSERSGKACCAAIDGLSSADALCDRLADSGAPKRYVVRPNSGEVIAAASMMLDAVRERQVTHIEGPALDASATRSTRRRIGSRGGWGWGGDGSCAIEAASLALWALKTSKRDPKRRMRVG